MAWTSLPCWRLWAAEVFHGQVHEQLIQVSLFSRAGPTWNLDLIESDPLLPSKSNFNDFNGFNIFQKKPSFNIFNLSIGPLPNGTPTTTAVNHRPSILVLEAREVL